MGFCLGGYVIDLTVVITQARFGEVVGISQPAVSDLLSRGVLTEGAVAGVWLIEYCAHLREVAAGRLASGDLDLAAERARLAKEQADKIALQNAVTRRELAPVFLIEEVLAKAGAKVAGILDAIPGQVRRRMPALPSGELDAIASEIAKARNIAAALSLDDLNADDQPDQDAVDNAYEPMEEAA